MASNDIWTELMLKNDSQALSIFSSSLDKYYQLLEDVGRDIYDSCIHEFYSLYTPRSYKRHGYLSGRNLYRANTLYYDGNTIHTVFDEYQLLPYGKDDKREMVFEFVATGLRGGPLPKAPEFPMEWYTSYPNAYSKYKNIWKSSQVILADILSEFVATGIQDTIHIAVDMIVKKI